MGSSVQMIRKPGKPIIREDIKIEEGKRLLEQGAKALGISLSTHQLNQFMEYLILLGQWNQHINLTGLRSYREIVIKHFLDSLTPLIYLPEKAKILDLGSGAGFPGLPIKIVRPNQSVTLIEASAKKVSFLKEVIRRLNLYPISVYQAYLGKGSPFLSESDQFEIIITRAVGKLNELLVAVNPYLAKGGKLLLMKGKRGLEEISALKSEIQKREFQIETPIVFTLPLLDQERWLIFLRKDR